MTGDVHEIDAMLHEAWDEVFNPTDAEPSVENFFRKYAAFIPQPTPMPREAFDVEALRKILQRMKSKGARGGDGWTVTELKALPDSILARLCTLLNTIDETGQWPSCLEIGLVTMLDKGEGLVANKLRPISVMSVLYRLWASFHMRHILEWQEERACEFMFGFRPHRGCDDAFWDTALDVEHALLMAEPLCGCSIDFQ